MVRDIIVLKHYYFFLNALIQTIDNFKGTLEMMQVEWPKQYGGIHKWFVGNQCNVSLSSPELLEVRIIHLYCFSK